MDALLIVIVISLLLVGGLMFISGIFDFRGRKTRARRAAGSKEQNNASESTKWRSVKIAPGLIACEYANILSGKIFLAREAPPLPLVKCAEKDCRCKYIHLDDRRSGTDRRVSLGEFGAYLPVTQTERRHLTSRRATDLAA